ncbi:MAG TPA: hypothetical protein VGS79_03035, partial [Puia sp.]|nr:hypothetical protein [Puia sp.]
ARQYANDGFDQPLEQLSEADQDKYWGRFGLNQEQLYKLFPQADSVHFPDVATWKGFVAGLNDKTIGPLLPGLEPKSLPATTDATGNAVAARIDLDGWLRNWTAFVNLLKDRPDLQSKLMATQWDALGQVDGNEAWYEKVFSAAGDVRSLQLEAISEQFKGIILQSTGASGANADAAVMTKDAITAIQAYANSRIDPQGGFFPVVADPFVLPPAELTSPPDWKGLLASLDGTMIEFTIKKEIDQTYLTPPPLAITVDVLDTPPQPQTPSVDDQDAQNEIAGHVLLMQRGDGLGATTYGKPWRYLNWVRLQTKSSAGTVLFGKSYVISAYLPEKDGRKQSALELTNEKLSLIAGHDAFDDRGSGGKVPDDSMQYLFDPHVDPASNRPDHVGYALWYGYNYRFASFVALNSGVLPQAIRATDWNLPDPAPALNGNLPLWTFPYLRRVPVSAVRVEALRMMPASGGRVQAMPVIQPPAGLQPLAFELPGWKDHTVVHYLLTDPALTSTAYQQGQLSFRLRKPTTPFWNWYAWLGDDANGTAPGMSVSYAQKALEQDLILRDANTMKDPNFDGKGHLCDPAVDNTFVIVVQEVFPTYGTPVGYDVTLNGVTLLNDPLATLKVQLGPDSGGDWNLVVAGDVATLTVKAGITVSVKIYPTVKSNLFVGGTNATAPKFYKWMQDAMQAADIDAGVQTAHLNSVFLKPVELLFEAAMAPAMLPKTLWDALWIDQQTDNVNLHLKKDKGNYVPLAYFSRLEVRHQVWSWNGRLDNSGALLTSNTQLDPVDGKTSDAMEWEAWAFSDRPDVSALVQDTNLLAFSPYDPNTKVAAIDQLLFTDTRPKEDKALYYRFNATAHSRYELLGNGYVNTVFGCVLVDKVSNGWRRYIRKCSRTVKLPKPTIRFILPLTKTIEGCTAEGEMATASLLVVLNDRWFTEAGLAEHLELGVDVVPDPRDGMTQSYMQAGVDPILSGESLTAVLDATRPKVILPVKGPAGLTFDFAAQTPELTSSAFIVPLPDLSKVLVVPDKKGTTTTGLGPWSLMQVAVRRTLQSTLCETGIAVESSFSEWSSKEWVQFVPATDSFIPKSWREAIQRNNYVQVNVQNGGKTITVPAGHDLPVLDAQRMQFFLVVTQKVYDIGGQPVEQYLATWQYDPVGGGFNLDGTMGKPWDGSGTEGYLRLMLVRCSPTPGTGVPIWNRLFGKNAEQQPDPTLVVDDPTAALPLVSERIPFKSIKS